MTSFQLPLLHRSRCAVYIQLLVLCVSLTVNNIMRHSMGALHCVLFVPILDRHICVRSGGI